MRGFLIFIVILLCAGCSKEESRPSFVGLWKGVVVNEYNPEDKHDMTLNLPRKGIEAWKTEFYVDCDVVPSYIHSGVRVGYPYYDDNKTNILLDSRYRESGYGWVLAAYLDCVLVKSDEMTIIMEIFDDEEQLSGQYIGVLYRSK